MRDVTPRPARARRPAGEPVPERADDGTGETAPPPAQRRQPPPAVARPGPLRAEQPGVAAPGPVRHPISSRAGRNVKPARVRLRHWFVLLTFLLGVVGPSAYTVWYLNERAADQYHSVVGFSVRSEEAKSPLSVLDAVVQTGASTASDTDILYQYISSQQIIEEP